MSEMMLEQCFLQEEECGDNNFMSVGRKKREAVDVENDANVANAIFSLKIKDDKTNAEGTCMYTGRALWVCGWVWRDDTEGTYMYTG